MGITQEQILAAVERYLPRTVNYARSQDLGERDTAAVFARLQQIVLSNLLVDPEAVFYIIYLASQRLLASVETVLELLEALSSTEQLRAIRGDEPSRIEDLTKLTTARQSLVRISTGLVQDNVFGDKAYQNFRDNIEGFLTDEVVPNAATRNKVVVTADIRSTMENLKAAWEDVIERRGLVFGLLAKYESEDLRLKVSANVISTVQSTLGGLETLLPNLSTEAQASLADRIATDLAAAEAAITILSAVTSPSGQVIAGPASDGRTPASYLVLEGTGRTEPVLPVLSGTDGLLRLEGPAAGAPFVGVTGRTVAPGLGTLTTSMQDASVPDFVAAGILDGMYVTFVDQGRSQVITSVTATRIYFSPAVVHQPGVDLRYAVTDDAPGRYLQSPSNSFWKPHVAGATESTRVVSGVGTGGFTRVNKTTGTDATNFTLQGVAGELFPYITSGLTSSETGNTITSAGATWLSSGVLPGHYIEILAAPNTGVYQIVSVDSETKVTVVPALPGVSMFTAYRIYESPDPDEAFRDVAAVFLSAGIAVGDRLRITSGTQQGTDFIDAVSQTVLGLVSGGHTHETGLTWQVIKQPSDRVHSAAVDFLAAGVVAGDFIDLPMGTFEILSVSTNYVVVDTPFVGIYFSGLAFSVYSSVDAVVSSRFLKSGGPSFVTLDVDAVMAVQEVVGGTVVERDVETRLEVDGVAYGVLQRDAVAPADAVTVPALASGTGEYVDTFTFEDAAATFVSSGVDPAKHALVILSGANAGQVFSILFVDSETQLTTTAAVVSDAESYEILPLLSSSKDWAVYAGAGSRHFTDSGDDPFTAAMEGSTLVWRPGEPEEQRASIDTYVAPDEVWLTGYFPQGETQAYAIIDEVFPGMEVLALSRRYSIRDVADETTLDLDPKFSNSPGEDIAFHVVLAGSDRISFLVHDPVGAAALDPVNGFPDSFFGYRVDLVATDPVQATYVKGYPRTEVFRDSFQINTSLRLGIRNIFYRIMAAYSGQSNVFIGVAPLVLPVVEDVLTVWGYPDVYTVQGVVPSLPDMSLTVSPTLPSGLQGLDYVVTRGGAQNYGRYVLYDSRNAAVDVDADTSLLRLHVAEVLISYGSDTVVVDPGGASGVVVDLGDGTTTSDTFEDVTTPAAFGTARFGDRLSVVYGATTRTTFLTAVVSATRVRFDPPLPLGTALTWILERNSVSASLEEAERLRREMEELQGIILNYTVVTNPMVDAVIDLLGDQKMDRAVDLLYDGRIDEFINLALSVSSYSTMARTSLQGVGGATRSGSQVDRNVAGVNPETGQPSPSARHAVSPQTALGMPEDVETRVAMARAISDLVDDELTRSLMYVSSEEQRNRAIYELRGIIESNFVSDNDPTLPWIAKTGSLYDRLYAKYQKARAAIQYMLDHPELFDDVEGA